MKINFIKKIIKKKQQKKNNKNQKEKKIKNISSLQDTLLIFNIITTIIANLTEILKKKKISDFFYDLSAVGVVFLVALVMIIRKITIKNYDEKNSKYEGFKKSKKNNGKYENY